MLDLDASEVEHHLAHLRPDVRAHHPDLACPMHPPLDGDGDGFARAGGSRLGSMAGSMMMIGVMMMSRDDDDPRADRYGDDGQPSRLQ